MGMVLHYQTPGHGPDFRSFPGLTEPHAHRVFYPRTQHIYVARDTGEEMAEQSQRST